MTAAQAEHDRVRKAAIRVYELHELRQEHRRIVEEERREEERLKAEVAIVEEEKRLRELKAKAVPQLPPEPEPPAPPPPPSTKPAAPSIANGSTPVKEDKQPESSTTPASAIKKPAATLAPPSGVLFAQNKPAQSNPFAPASASTSAIQPPAGNPFQNAAGPPLQPAATPAAPPAQPKPSVAATPKPPQSLQTDRYIEIHQALKKLRKDLQAQSKIAGSPLKGKMGTFRREIRVSIGQLTAGKGANTQPVSTDRCLLGTHLTIPRSTKLLLR